MGACARQRVLPLEQSLAVARVEIQTLRGPVDEILARQRGWRQIGTGREACQLQRHQPLSEAAQDRPFFVVQHFRHRLDAGQPIRAALIFARHAELDEPLQNTQK